MQYLLRQSSSCGPDCLAAVTGRSHADVDAAWGIRDISKFSDLQDSPWAAFSALAALGIPWKIRTCGDILNGIAKPEKTIILIHALATPGLVGALSPFLNQHYVALKAVSTGFVTCYFGAKDAKGDDTRTWTFDTFSKIYSGGSPACAYEVGIGDTKLTWYQWAYAKLVGKFI